MPSKSTNKKLTKPKVTVKAKTATKNKAAVKAAKAKKASVTRQGVRQGVKKAAAKTKSKPEKVAPNKVVKAAASKKVADKKKTIAVKASRPSAKPIAKLASRLTAKAAAKPAKKLVAKPMSAKNTEPRSKTVQSKSLSGKTSSERKPLEPRPQTISSEDLERFKIVLLQKRRRLMGDVAMMSEEALGSEEGAIDNHAPIHPAEVGSHSFEQEFTLDLLSHDGDRIHMIEMALEKLDEGTYGQCDECGARIPKGRLDMLPESIFCVKCASKMEGNRF